MFKGMFGRGAQSLMEMPPHIAQIDHIVCVSPPDIRIVIIKFYGTGGTFDDKALLLGMTRRELRNKIERAEWHVNSELDQAAAPVYCD